MLHTQLSLPPGDKAPGGQGVQDGLPALAAYVPAGHSKQSVEFKLPAGELVPDGQLTHVLSANQGFSD